MNLIFLRNALSFYLKFLLVFFFFIGSFTVWGQRYLDSLKQVTQNGTIEEKASAYYRLGSYFIYDKTPDAVGFAKRGLELTPNCDCDGIEYNLLYLLGWAEIELHHWKEGKKAAEQLLRGIENGKYTNEKGKANIYRMLGTLYGHSYDFEESLRYYELSIEAAKALNDPSAIGGAYCNIGLLCEKMEDQETARKYYKLAIAALENGGNRGFLANAYNNLESITEDFTERARLLDAALLIHQDLIEKEKVANVYLAKGDLLIDQNQPQRALEMFQKSLEPIDTTTIRWYFSLGGIGRGFLQLGQFDSAVHYITIALDTIAFYGGYKETERDMQHNLTLAYLGLRDTEMAEKYYLRGIETWDSLFSENKIKAKERFDAQFENAQNQKQLAEQKLEITQQRVIRNRIVGGGLLFFLFAALLFQRFYYHQKRKKQAAETALLAEQQEAEQLRELDQLKSKFFANISHELRTPLTLVAAPLNDALQSVKPSLLKNQLQLAHSNTQKLLRLVNEILDLSKLEAGKIETKKSEVHLLETIRRIFYAFESIAQVRGLHLQFNTNISKDLKVYLDSEKLEKILNNLLSNAIKFTEKGGQITLEAIHENEQFNFAVSDTGMGISAEELPKVFDRFYQSIAENAPLQGGTGIGLSLAKELAHLMQGDLRVESEVGKGSQFHLSLPIELTDKQQKVATQARQEAISIAQPLTAIPAFQPLFINDQKPKILIVEDNEDMSQYLAQQMGEHYAVTCAYDGLEALERMEKETFDLITCDVMMPNMDGFAFREQVMENEAWRQIPFVMLTARAMEADKLKGLRLGVDDYLTKPFNIHEVQARLHNLLTNKIARAEFKEEAATGEAPPLSVEEQLIKKAETFVLKRMDDTELRVEDLAKELNLSPRHLSRTMKKIIGISPVNFILEIRLQRARQLLENRQFMTVSEVRYEVGIESASYFTRKFTERFGKNPSGYIH